jgi:hypothetical protein
MKSWVMLAGLVPSVLAYPAAAAGPGRLALRLLYVGNDKARAAAYADFLGEHFSRVRTALRDTFDPSTVGDADVVLLDWSQSESDLKRTRSPLGRLEAWSKPTVLLGSAGLLIAGQWQLIGGAG